MGYHRSVVPQTTDPVGIVLAGRYEILRQLGTESLGEVWAARDRKTGGLVQVKVLLPELATDRVRFARFGREMTASFLVTHPNTVEVLDYGEDHGMHFLVLEFVAGRTLAQVLEAEGPLPWPRVAAIVAQVAAALGAAHQEGIVHRALSLDNIVLLDNAVDGDFVKVRDFGMAKLNDDTPEGAVPAGEENESELTATGLRVGDPRYMPPEYIATSDYQAKGDVYALGAVAFHLLTGRTPFIGTRSQMLTQHISAPVPDVAALVPGVPQYLAELVRDLLAKGPERRPGNHKIVTRLEDGAGHRLDLPELLALDSEGRVPAPAASTPQPVPWPAIAVLAGVLLCAGATALFLVLAAVLVVVYALSMPA